MTMDGMKSGRRTMASKTTTENIGSREYLAQFESLGNAAPFVERMQEVIDRIPLFEGFSPEDVRKLAESMSCYRAPAGAEIIREGEDGDFMLLLLEGNMEIVKTGKDGLPHRVGVVNPGKTLGEMSLVDGEPRFASCVALDTITFAVLDRVALGLVLVNDPQLGIKLLMDLLMLLNQRLRDVGKRLMAELERS